jgi:hypothetical protein
MNWIASKYFSRKLKNLCSLSVSWFPDSIILINLRFDKLNKQLNTRAQRSSAKLPIDFFDPPIRAAEANNAERLSVDFAGISADCSAQPDSVSIECPRHVPAIMARNWLELYSLSE